MEEMTPEDAKRHILSGNFPESVTVSGSLEFKGEIGLKSLPSKLNVRGSLIIYHCPNLVNIFSNIISTLQIQIQSCQNLTSISGSVTSSDYWISDCPNLSDISDIKFRMNLSCISVINCPRVKILPYSIDMASELILSGNNGLQEIPALHNMTELTLDDCSSLKALPSGLYTGVIDISGCSELTDFPEDMQADTIRFSEQVQVIRNRLYIKNLPGSIMSALIGHKVHDVIAHPCLKAGSPLGDAVIAGIEEAPLGEYIDDRMLRLDRAPYAAPGWEAVEYPENG